MKRTKSRMRFCLTLLILNLLFIWGNSLLPAPLSDAFSNWVKEILQTLSSSVGPGGEGVGHGLLRKVAHFSEFATLGFLLGWLQALMQSVRKKHWAYPLLGGFLVACVDETIQLFVPGRSGSFMDVGIDTLGATLGIALITLIQYFIICKKSKEKKV